MTSTQRKPTSPVLELTDPIGVLSIYVDADPSLAAGPRPAWQSPVRAGLRRLVREARLSRPRGERLALEAGLAELEPELDTLLDPRSGGRGRALFAALGRGESHRVDVRAPLAPQVALGRRATILPLLAAEQEGRPAGAASVSWARVEQAEWRPDALRSLTPIALAEPQPEPRRGRSGTNPAVPQPFPERDRFESAAGVRLAARLREAGAELAAQAETRGWDVLVADGDPRLVDELAAGFRSESCELVRSPQPVAGLAVAAARERVAAIVRGRRAERVERLLAAVEGSAAATLDPELVDRALAEGRVERLLLAVPPRGARSPRAESLLRRALATGAELTVVPAGALPAGIAALLRW